MRGDLSVVSPTSRGWRRAELAARPEPASFLPAMQVTALIPARGGSKGIPRKNMVPLRGKPLVVHSIEQAQASQLIDRVIVTTDDEEIAETARRAGAEVPFMRPSEIAQDLSTDLEFMQHYIAWQEGADRKAMPDIIVQLRPTYPNRTPEFIDECIRDFDLSTHTSLRTVVPIEKSPFKMYTLEPGGSVLTPLFESVDGLEQPYNACRQVSAGGRQQSGEAGAPPPPDTPSPSHFSVCGSCGWWGGGFVLLPGLDLSSARRSPYYCPPPPKQVLCAGVCLSLSHCVGGARLCGGAGAATGLPPQRLRRHHHPGHCARRLGDGGEDFPKDHGGPRDPGRGHTGRPGTLQIIIITTLIACRWTSTEMCLCKKKT